MTWSAAPEVVVNSRPFPDDGIPLLTDVVDAAEYPQSAPPSDGLEGHDDAYGESNGPLSLAMFPVLEANAPLLPATPPVKVDVSHAQYVPPAEAEVAQAQYATPAEAEVSHAQHGQSALATTVPIPLQAWMDSLAALRGRAQGMTNMAATPIEAAPAQSSLESFPDPAPTNAFTPQDSPPTTGFSSIAAESPVAEAAPYQSSSLADRGPDHPAALATPSAFSDPAKAGPRTEAAVPDASDVPAPLYAREPGPWLSAPQMETRIFESIAARMDKLLDQRLEAVVPGVVEAALAGVTAGLAASVRQALREAVEHAVRDEFAKRHPEEF